MNDIPPFPTERAMRNRMLHTIDSAEPGVAGAGRARA